MVTEDPWEILYEGVEQLSDKFLSVERVQPKNESRDRIRPFLTPIERQRT